MKNYLISFFIIFINFQLESQIWKPDLENGTYKNPIIYADYSDPDVVKAGDDFYMTASSFNCVPALPILHSKDLVNWKLINYAIKEFNDPDFDIPQHGNGVWAPSIRFYNEYFYIYYGDPDRGIFMVKTKDPYGEWTKPVLVKKACGNIDPCPLWDDDGKVYLVHAFAHSRAGVKSLLQVNEMNKEGTKTIDKGYIVFDGHKDHYTIEGPKFYKRNGYFYIFAPAGGVKTGWQTVLRSKNIYGPYQDKIVLHQGNTEINGPHQGALIELESGESWFIHFQDKAAYGRIVHLQPVQWINDWPVIGKDINNDNIGEPVHTYNKPSIDYSEPYTGLSESDEFNGNIGLQWQWHANPKKGWTKNDQDNKNLILNCVKKSETSNNLWDIPNLLLQKFPAPSFSATVKLTTDNFKNGDQCGLLVMGEDYAYISLKFKESKLFLSQVECIKAYENNNENINNQIELNQQSIYFKVKVTEKTECTFYYSIDGNNYSQLGNKFHAKPGRWIGAKVGIFAIGDNSSENIGSAKFDWFRVDNY